MKDLADSVGACPGATSVFGGESKKESKFEH
jgi:hypothetical protein